VLVEEYVRFLLFYAVYLCYFELEKENTKNKKIVNVEEKIIHSTDHQSPGMVH
jgi:hypothetical protein